MDSVYRPVTAFGNVHCIFNREYIKRKYTQSMNYIFRDRNRESPNEKIPYAIYKSEMSNKYVGNLSKTLHYVT